ncbi:carbohydrate ABC transporter permease [Jatrophihabitans endophyticus]|uniref:carbohydrate ABC transporter permease n=1 Tax=Jatrophihabitans endophyticus TaxID=1206085 RepID=UPI001A0D2D6E|nr:carbohydrate ABC transporter permease [Jatrophihabitans endophyticus]MBE7188224.1 carbohydrate ABC transporter permease [Jatrophihabitans endophyticus]
MRLSLPARTVVYLLVVVSVLLVVFPLLWMLLSAVKTNGEIINPNASLIPTDWHWSNIKQAWEAAPFGRYFANTALFSVVTTIGQVATGLLAGYAFAMFDFPLRRVLFYVVLSGLMIPFTVVIVPVVQIVADLHWINTYQGLIVPNLASALGCFLFRQFFLNAPLELGEAARIDGAGEWRIFWSIYRPLAGPMTAAFTMIAFLQNWNNFLFPLVVTDSQSKMMVSQGLTVFQSDPINKYSYNLLMAGSLIAVVPVLVVALVAQRRIVDGLALGAVK